MNNEHLQIGIGEKSKFFTLRHHWEEPNYEMNAYGRYIVTGFTAKSEHFQNLSQNYQEALTKAKRAALAYNLPLSASETRDEQLSEIRRREREEIAAENLAEAQARDAEITAYLGQYKITTTVLWFGKYAGQSIYSVIEFDRDYLEFLAAGSDETNLFKARIRVLLDRTPVAEKLVSNYIGTIGQRLTLECSVVFTKWIDTQFGQSRLIKFQIATGETLVSFYSGNYYFEIGEKVTIAGTVKAHEEYNGEKQTKINRITVK